MAENVTKNYEECFNTAEYLEWYENPLAQSTLLRNLHLFWQQFGSQNGLSLLEFGGGPIVSGLISACPYVECIVFAEYLESNRKAVDKWIKNDPDAFDWKATFDFVVQDIEGGNKIASDQRQTDLRQKIQAVIPCDVKGSSLLEPPNSLPEKYCPPYDVVSTSLCIEAVVESDTEYEEAIAKLVRLIKPGGYLVLHGSLQESFYTVGKRKFYAHQLRKEIILEGLDKAGMNVVDFSRSPSELSRDLTDSKGYYFVYAKRGLSPGQ